MIGDGVHAGCRDALVPGRVVFHRGRPGDVVNRPGASEAALGRWLVVGVDAAARSAPRFPAVSVDGVKPSVSSSRGLLASGLDEYARTPSKPWSASSVGISGCSATSGASSPVDTTSRWRSPSGSSNVRPPSSRPTADELGCESPLPEVERVVRRDAPLDGVNHPRARAPAGGSRVLEERDVRARAPGLVRVEEVVDGRVVLIDGLLHEPEAEDARVEVHVSRRVGRDARDVVDPVEAHNTSLASDR